MARCAASQFSARFMAPGIKRHVRTRPCFSDSTRPPVSAGSPSVGWTADRTGYVGGLIEATIALRAAEAIAAS
jgi:hypothetical protein